MEIRLRFRLALFPAASLVLFAAPAFAHKLIVDARVKGDKLRVEAYYEDEIPAQMARIVVESESKQVVAEGRTDERGLWSCPVPPPGMYVVRAESVGHSAKETIVVPSADSKKKTDTVSAHPSGSFVAPRESDSSASEKPARDDKTGTPWLKLAIGFAVITILCGASLYLMRKRR